MVEPVDVFEGGGELNVVEATPRASRVDELPLVELVAGLGPQRPVRLPAEDHPGEHVEDELDVHPAGRTPGRDDSPPSPSRRSTVPRRSARPGPRPRSADPRPCWRRTRRGSPPRSARSAACARRHAPPERAAAASSSRDTSTGDPHDLGDRLDSPPQLAALPLMPADEPHHLFDWRSSSAPKNVAAAVTMSFVRRRFAFSRSIASARRALRSSHPAADPCPPRADAPTTAPSVDSDPASQPPIRSPLLPRAVLVLTIHHRAHRTPTTRRGIAHGCASLHPITGRSPTNPGALHLSGHDLFSLPDGMLPVEPP